MPITVFHSLTATTPDNTSYEIRPSHWNSVHVGTLSAAGSEIIGAFSNDPSVNISFSTNAGGKVIASANVTAAPSPVNVTGNGSSVNAQTIAFTNSNGLTLGVSTAANGATITGSYTVPTGFLTTAAQSNQVVNSLNGSTGQISLATGSSLSSSSNGSTITFGLASNITTALQSAGNYLTTAAQSNHVVNSLNGSVGAMSLAVGSSLSSSTNGSTITFGLATDITTALQSTGAYLTTARASNDAIGLNTAKTNVTWTVNSSGLSLNAAGYAGTGTSATNASVTLNSNGLAISVGAGGAFSLGASTLGNTAGNTGVTGTRVVLAGGNNITVSQGTDANGATITISGANAGGAQTGISGIADSANTQTVGTVSFANSNGISFGLSTGANTGTITASYTVPTVTNSSWTVSDHATSGTVALLAFTQSNGLTLSLSTSNNGHHTVFGSYTVPTSYLSNINGSSGAMSLTVGSSLSSSTNGSTITFGLASNITTALQSAGNYLTTAAQSSVSNVSGVLAATNNTGGGTATLSGNVSFSDANGFTFYTSAGNAVVGSYTVPSIAGLISAINVTDSVTSENVTQLMFSNGHGVTFGLSTAGGGPVATLTASVSQTNQTLGIYASSQTLGTTSSTYDARSLSVVGSGVVSVGWSNSSLVINAPAAGGDGVNVVSMAITTSGGATSGTTYSQSSGTIGLVAGSNITLQQSSNSIVIFGASGGAGGNMSLYAKGNTTVSSSIGSIPPTSFSLGGYGGVSVGYSSTNTTGIGTVIVSAPATSSLVGTNGIGISSNGSTISISNAPLLTYVPFTPASTASQTIIAGLANTSASVFVYPFTVEPRGIAFDVVNIGMFLSNSASAATSLGWTGSLLFGIYSNNASTLSRISSNSLSWCVTSSGASGTLSYPASTGTAGYTWTTTAVTTTAQAASFWGQQGTRVVGLAFTNTMSLSAGTYWLALLSLNSSSGHAGGQTAGIYGNVWASASSAAGIGQAASAITTNWTQQNPFGPMGPYTVSQSTLPAAISFNQIANTVSIMPMMSFLST